MELDKDLMARQEARALAKAAAEAQTKLGRFSQQQLDAIVEAVAKAFAAEAAGLASMAVKETGFGNMEDKITKNLFASKAVAEAVRDMKTVGILKECPEEKLWEVGVPVGVIAAIVPSTNPTSTVCYKAMIALKAGNAIVFSPHPKALECTKTAARIVAEAAEKAGAPRGSVACLSIPSLDGSEGGSPDSGHRRSGHGSIGLFLRQARHRRGSRQWPCLYSFQCGCGSCPWVHPGIQNL